MNFTECVAMQQGSCKHEQMTVRKVADSAYCIDLNVIFNIKFCKKYV